MESKGNNFFKLYFNPLYIFLILLASLLFSLSIQFSISYKSTTFERIVYNVLNMDNLDTTFSSLSTPIMKVCSAFIVIASICIIPLFFSLFYDKEKYINILKKRILIYPVYAKRWSLILLSISFITVLISLSVPEFIFNNIIHSDLYEDYYVEYKDELVSFPDQKKNLITIYVESFESSVFSLENGGSNKQSYMPLMEEMTGDYINFSNNDTIGGFYQLNGTGWTAASLIGQTAGIPIYIETKDNNGRYLEGAVSIGEILSDNGYNNYFLMGSDANFAERDNYLLEHGNYDILDYDRAIDNKLIEEDYFLWWGYEDDKLYNFAKKKLLDISKDDEPFNLSILTADTHFYDGYVDDNCPLVFDSNYANSYYCADLMLYKFIGWLQNQEFYDDTVIVVVGDHLTMRDDFFESDKKYERTIYNLFINSSIKTNNTKNRLFTAFDIYPTTLAAIGAHVDGDRLALGTNLFSDKKTLMEELGKKKFTKEVAKISKYYNKNILQK